MRYLHLASVSLLAALAQPALADTLADAIASAYSNNPEITAARAQLRATDETVEIARTDTRPNVGVTGSFVNQLTDRFGNYGQVWTGGIQITQPVWEGGRVRAGISAAEARVDAARARLQATEHAVVTDTVTAYADVLRMQSIVALNENQIRVLEQQLQASKDRFEVGDLTRTDVAQSDARLAAARSNLIGARTQEIAVKQAYERLVGRPPVDLQPLPPLPPLPATEVEVHDRAMAANPNMQAARLDEQAAQQDVRQAKAQRGPSVGVTAAATYNHSTGALFARLGLAPQIGVSANMPLFTGGLIAANVRAAQARQSAALERISLTERQISETAANSFAQLRASEAVIQASKVLVDANALAAEGVKQENQVGSRDILDVLNAEQELLNARVQLVTAERDRYVAGFTLLEVAGAFQVVLDGAPVARYDPEVNEKRIKAKGWSEFGYDPDPATDRARNVAPLTSQMGPQQ